MRHRSGFAEGKARGGELVEDRSERPQVTPWIAAHPQHLLGRHVDPVTERDAKFLGQEVGIMTVMRESEVDEHRVACAIQHVGRLQVEVHHVLPVKLVQPQRKGGTQARDLPGWQRSAGQARR